MGSRDWRACLPNGFELTDLALRGPPPHHPPTPNPNPHGRSQLWIMLPQASYQLLWLPALAMAAGFVVAVKLQESRARDGHLLPDSCLAAARQREVLLVAG